MILLRVSPHTVVEQIPARFQGYEEQRFSPEEFEQLMFTLFTSLTPK